MCLKELVVTLGNIEMEHVSIGLGRGKLPMVEASIDKCHSVRVKCRCILWNNYALIAKRINSRIEAIVAVSTLVAPSNLHP
jgi:hypothetical protein